ncbi:MAG: Flp pilus assembly complex ATPase component TadA, partial [Candidatus Omnitrophica bacterium]|nr:Flp pilus assembly complex ATPase component TadA [Candidatus Omnitrophota bacterium]
MDKKEVKLGDVLIEKGLINNDQLLQALQRQKDDGRKLGEILVETGVITEQQVAHVIADIYNLTFVHLNDVRIDETVYGVVPSPVLKKHNILPLELSEDILTVATNNPLDVEALQEIQYVCGKQVRPVVAGKQDISNHLDNYFDNLNTLQGGKKGDTTGANETPIIKLVESIISMAIKERASDIHFEPLPDHMRVRFRIDGVLYERNPISKDIEKKVISRIKIVSGMDVADSRRPQDGRMTLIKYPEYDIRVSTLPDIMGENLVLRILSKAFKDFSFNALGMDEREQEAINHLIKQPYGMILVTGPTGAGKSTTLYSILNSLNNTEKNIITVEDPVEYKIEGINQTNINNRAGYNFATALRHILRH